MDEEFELHFQYKAYNRTSSYINSCVNVNWNQIFSYIGPKIISPMSADSFKYTMDTNFINKITSRSYAHTFVDEDDANTITVIGVSPDSIKNHKSFKEKQSLNFILLSDPEHKLAEKFEVWKEKSMYGKKYMGIERSTFIIDKDGRIEKEWRKVKVKGHVDEVIEYLSAI